ncbi:MAG: tyrosine-type recombinase/integrase [Deltaproteobacteria bacterium]|nr:tyrosine-type recombinase/integrase [Deltaproteobacteria bacterium]
MAESLAEAVQLKETLAISQAEPERQRFSDYAERWIEAHASGVSPSTRERYVTELAYAVEAFGDFYVDAIDEEDVKKWRNQMDARPATKNSRLRTLRLVLEPACRRGVLRYNPARAVKEVSDSRTQGRRGNSLRPDEFARFVRTTAELSGTAFKADIGRMILTAAWTGMRMGELRAVKWEDLRDGELFVVRAVWNRIEKETKTDDPRLVVIPEPLAKILAEQRKWLMESQHPGLVSGLIFPADPRHAKASSTRRGACELTWFRSGSVLTPALTAIAEKAGVPSVSPHSFRRTYENLLRKAGVNDLVRRSLAGWRTEDTQAIYASHDREERDGAGEALVKLVTGAFK